jgi:hypothetical protein
MTREIGEHVPSFSNRCKKGLDKRNRNCLYQTSCRESTIMGVSGLSGQAFSYHRHFDSSGKRLASVNPNEGDDKLATIQ